MAGQGGVPEYQPTGMQGIAGLPINPELQKLIQSRFNQVSKLNPLLPMMQNRVANVMGMPTSPAQYTVPRPQVPTLPAGVAPTTPQGAMDPTQLLGQGMSLQRRLMGAVPPPPQGQQLSPLLAMLYRRFGGA